MYYSKLTRGLDNFFITDGGGFDFLYSPVKLLTSDFAAQSKPTDVPTFSQAIDGTDNSEILNGTAGDDIINGFGAGDQLNGLGGNDTLDGGEGSDVLNGGDGDDIFIHANVSSDQFNGDADNDTFRIFVDGNLSINGGSGYDTIEFNPFAAAVNLSGSAFAAVEEFQFQITATLMIEAGRLDAVNLVSQINSSTIVIEHTTAGTTDLSNKIEVGASGVFTGFEFGVNIFNITGATGNWNLNGGNVNDTLTGGDGDDTLIGGDGADTLEGGEGYDILWSYIDDLSVTPNIQREDGDIDTLRGGNGSDQLYGGFEDQLFGDAGTDYIDIVNVAFVDGGADEDTLNYDARWGSNLDHSFDFQTLWTTGTATLTRIGPIGDGSDDVTTTVTSIENVNILLGDGDDTVLFGTMAASGQRGSTIGANVDTGAGNDFIQGSSLNDVLSGGENNDTISGGDGNDTIIGSSHVDILNGEGGDDTIFADFNSSSIDISGGDIISGGDGNDTIHGATGDTLNGDADNDTFWIHGFADINGGTGTDTIEYFALDRTGTLLQTENADSLVLDLRTLISDGTGTYSLTTRNDSDGSLNIDAYQGTIADVEAITIIDFRDFFIVPGGFTDAYDATLYLGDVNISAIMTSSGNDTIIDGSTSTSILAGSGDDTIEGHGGDDHLFGNDGNDILNGGEGNDSITGGDGADTIDGGSGNDTIYASESRGQDDLDLDVLIGGDGDDTIFAGYLDDISGGLGNDFMIVEDIATVEGGDGFDTIYLDIVSRETTADYVADFSVQGTGGTWSRSYTSSGVTTTTSATVSNVEIISVSTGSGDDVVTFGTVTRGAGESLEGMYADTYYGNDIIQGSNLNDTLDGNEDNDIVRGGDGDDIVIGGAGSDMLYGDDGNDTLWSSLNNLVTSQYGGLDVIRGGNGNDTIYGGVNDILHGDAGNDTFTVYGLAEIYGGTGEDTLDHLGLGYQDSPAPDTEEIIELLLDLRNAVDGGQGIYTMTSETIGNPGAGTTTLLGAISGIEMINGIGLGDFINYSLPSAAPNGGRYAPDATVYIGEFFLTNGLVTGSGDDLIIDGNFGTYISSGSGDDHVQGFGGNDRLLGGAGQDTLEGGEGDDFIDGGSDADILTGGAGEDEFVLHLSYDVDGDVITDFELGDWLYLRTQQSGQATYLGDGAFTGQTGEFRAEVIGNDTVFTFDENGDMVGDATFTVENFTGELLVEIGSASGLAYVYAINRATSSGGELIGSNGLDVLTGSAAADQLFGLNQRDELIGNAGADLLNGGLGSDLMTGGAGADQFAFSVREGEFEGDVITDFTAEDTIVFTWNDAPDDFDTSNFQPMFGSSISGNDTLVSIGGTYMPTEFIRLENTQVVLQQINLTGDSIILAVAVPDDFGTGIGTGAQQVIAGDPATQGEFEIEGDSDWIRFSGTVGETVNFQLDLLTLTDAGFQLYDPTGNVVASGTVDAGSAVMQYTIDRIGDYFIAIDPTQVNGQIQPLTGTYQVLAAVDPFPTISGTQNNNTLTGTAAAERLNGAAGNDTIQGAGGADIIDGGSGFDTASYAGASSGVTANLFSGQGNRSDAAGDSYLNIEALRGSSHADVLVGRDGAGDYLFGGQGGDSLRANGGNDFVFGEGGNDLIFAGFGADTINGGDGVDTLMLTNASAGSIIRLDLGTGSLNVAEGDTYTNIENVAGSAFRDLLYGDDNNNFLDGRGGNDLLIGNGGADVLDGGAGFDTASYANSAASVSVSLFLGRGPGSDIIRNVEHLVGSNFNDTLVGNDGVDETLDGGSGADNLRGNGGNDTLNGGDGNDILFSGFGNDAHDGGAGFDTVTYAQASAGVIVRLDLGTGSLGHAAGDTYANIENITGSSAFRDLLYGNDIGNVIDGRGGNDLLIGNGGSDTLIGGNGFDKLDGGTGFDVLTGGSGNDTFVFKAGYQADRITDFTIGEDQVDLTSFGFTTYSQVSSLMYTSGADTVITFGGGDAIRLVGISLGDLSASDFVLTASSGNAPAEKAAFAPANDSFDFGDDFGTQDESTAFMQQELMAEWDASQAMNVPIYKTNDYGVIEIFTPDDPGYDFGELGL